MLNEFADKVEALLDEPMVPNHIAKMIVRLVSEMRNVAPVVAQPVVDHPAA